MQFSIRSLLFVIALIAVAFGAWNGLKLWHKARLCGGRADQYAAEAAEWRTRATGADVPEADAAAMRREANEREFIARKYQRVADQPWLPYPAKPLISNHEKRQLSEMSNSMPPWPTNH